MGFGSHNARLPGNEVLSFDRVYLCASSSCGFREFEAVSIRIDNDGEAGYETNL